MADLKIFADVKSERARVLDQEHRALYYRTWARARSTGVNFETPN